jgi:hypothetical protein
MVACKNTDLLDVIPWNQKTDAGIKYPKKDVRSQIVKRSNGMDYEYRGNGAPFTIVPKVCYLLISRDKKKEVVKIVDAKDFKKEYISI